MLVCDCGFWRNHQEGVTAKELAAMTERAKVLRVTPISDAGGVRIFRVEGGEAIHYITMYPGGDKDGSGWANCKHLIAVRSFLEVKDGQARNIQEIDSFEGAREVDDGEVLCSIGAVG